jgi:hypothetical protein
MPLRPQDVFERLNGMEVDGAGTWSARLDIAAEKSCWLIRCSGQRLTTETSTTDPNEWDSRPEAEMCVWYKSAKLFMKDAKGLLNEHAFAAEYVKGSIRMTGDREKAQARVHYCHASFHLAACTPHAPIPACALQELAKVLQRVAPRLRKMVRDAAGADDEAGDDAPGRPSMLLGALLVVAFRVFAWARYVPGLEHCVHNLWAASRWVRRRYRSSSAAALPYTAPLDGERRACASASASAVHAPTVRLLEGTVTRSDSVGLQGRGGYGEGGEGREGREGGEASGSVVGSSAAGAMDDCESVKSDESTVSQALARLPWHERHLGTDLLLSSWLWVVGCVAYALNSGAELYASCCPISSDRGHIYGTEIAEIAEIAEGDAYLSVGVHLNLSAEVELLSERGADAKQLGDAPALLGAAGALRRTLELFDSDLPGHAHAHAPLFDAQSCASVASLILWCDFVSALFFVFGCCVLLYSAYPEQLLQIADALSRPPRELSWLETYFTSNLMLATTQIFTIGTLLCRKQSKTRRPRACGELALQRPLSAAGHALGCPKLRSASAYQPVGPYWPVTWAHFRHRHAAARAAGAAARRRRAGQPGRVRAARGPDRPAAAAVLLVVHRDGLQPAQERRPRL